MIAVKEVKEGEMALTSQERLRVVEILDTWASAGESPQAAVAKVLEEFPDIEIEQMQRPTFLPSRS